MPFAVHNRDELPGATTDEFEKLVATLKQFLFTEHNEDGTHIQPVRGVDNVPIGLVSLWPTGVAPTGWLLCNGAAVSRLTYGLLFDLIGVTYGAGNGTTTFNIPDLRGRFALGVATAGTGSVLAGTGGSIDHLHTGPAHTHSIASGGAHDHDIDSEAAHTHTFSGTTDFGSAAGTTSPGLSVAGTPSDHQHPFSGETDADGAHDHGGATSSDGAHDHGAATGSSGSGNTGTANPPFLALNYIIATGVA